MVGDVSGNGVRIDSASPLMQRLGQLIAERRIMCAVETGTFIGNGSTPIIADYLRRNGKSILCTIESNPIHYKLARTNLRTIPNIRCFYGLSFPRHKIPSTDATTEWLGFLRETYGTLEGANVDDAENFAENAFLDGQDDWIGFIVKYLRPELFFLDSAGHVGFVEFEHLLSVLDYPCLIGLDDVDHAKHVHTVTEAMKDDRFTMLFRTEDRWGGAVLEFKP
jgi:hypothetical protein